MFYPLHLLHKSTDVEENYVFIRLRGIFRTPAKLLCQRSCRAFRASRFAESQGDLIQNYNYNSIIRIYKSHGAKPKDISETALFM